MLERMTYDLGAIGICYLDLLVGVEGNGDAGAGWEGLGGGHCRTGRCLNCFRVEESEACFVIWHGFEESGESHLIP